MNKKPEGQVEKFKLSQILTTRKAPPRRDASANPPVQPPQKATQNTQKRATSSDNKKPKFAINLENVKKKEVKDGDAIGPTQLKKKTSKKGNLLHSAQEGKTVNLSTKSFAGKKVVTDGRTVFGQSTGNNMLSNYNKTNKVKSKIFDNDLETNEYYSSKNFIYPISVKIKTEDDESKKKQSALLGAIQAGADQQKNMDDNHGEVLQNEFCFFQLPANLPIEGCYKKTPFVEDPDVEIGNQDILAAFLSKKFDSTGYYLERDFKLMTSLKEQMESKIKEEEEKKPESISLTDETAPKESEYDAFQLGKLYKMKDGSLKMRIGDSVFDVTDGVQDNFYKELFSFDFRGKIAQNLFPVEKKFIVKPDIASYI